MCAHILVKHKMSPQGHTDALENHAHKQPGKHFVSLSHSHASEKLPAAALQKYSLSLNSDPEILESCLSKLLCCEMTSTSPMEQ